MSCYRIPRSLGECVDCNDPTSGVTDAVVTDAWEAA
jgi:hypothetical protein